MHKILQNHLLCAFVANLKIDTIYALYPESFCDKNLAIRKVFAFCDSARARNKPSRKDQVLTSINQGIPAELMTPNLWPKGRLGRAVEVGMTTSHCAYFCAREKKTIYSFRPSCSMQLYKSSFQFYQAQFILVLLLMMLSKVLIKI